MDLNNSNLFTKDPEGREILVTSVRQVPDVDRPLVLLLIAVYAGLDRTEAAIKNTWSDWGEILSAMNDCMREFIPD